MRLRDLFLTAVLVVAAVAVSAPARATTTDEKDVTCPLCSNEFTVDVVRSTNTFGGLDPDLFAHARGECPVTFAVWTCPKCRFSARLDRFEKGVGPGAAAKVREGLEPIEPIAPDARQSAIPAWVQFDLAARVLDLDGAGVLERCQLLLEATWATRAEAGDFARFDREAPDVATTWTAAVARWRELRAPASDSTWDLAQADIRGARALAAEAAAERAKGGDPFAAEMLAAVVLVERGESADVLPVLRAVESSSAAPKDMRAAAKRFREIARHERRFREQLVELADAATRTGAVPDDTKGIFLWRVGDTRRRLGDVERARADCLAAFGPGMPLMLFSQAAAHVASFSSPVPEDVLAAGRRAAIAAQMAVMTDEDKAEDAARMVRGARDPALVAAVLPLLTHESRAVRLAAISVLTDDWDPGDAAVDALVRVMSDDEAQSVRPVAARALMRIGSSRAAAGFVEELSYRTDVQTVAVRALGLLGGADAVPALLDAKGADPASVLESVQNLANRPFEDTGAAAAWYAAHRGEARTDWVVSGFREMALAVPDTPWKTEHVPVLVGWLEHPSAHVRANALRVLREITGERFGWGELADRSTTARAQQARAIAVGQWRAWWESKRPK